MLVSEPFKFNEPFPIGLVFGCRVSVKVRLLIKLIGGGKTFVHKACLKVAAFQRRLF